MTLDDKIQRYKEFLGFIKNELPKYAILVSSNDLSALITNRVIQEGKNHTGGKFKSYSTRDVPAYKYWGKSRTQSAEKRVRTLARSRGVLDYAEFRRINNLKTDTKNFEFSGEMWRKFGVIKEQISGDKFTVILGGKTKIAQEKIDDNSDREGVSIIEASEGEIRVIEKTIQDWLNREGNRILNAI